MSGRKRDGVGSHQRARRHELLLCSQAMLVWNLTHGSGCKTQAAAIARRQMAMETHSHTGELCNPRKSHPMPKAS